MSDYYIEFVRAPSVLQIEIPVHSHEEGVDFVMNPGKHLSLSVRYGDIVCLVRQLQKFGKTFTTSRDCFSFVVSKSNVKYYARPPIRIYDIVTSEGSAIRYSRDEISKILEYGYSWHSYWNYMELSRWNAIEMAYVCDVSGISLNHKYMLLEGLLSMSLMSADVATRRKIKDAIRLKYSEDYFNDLASKPGGEEIYLAIQIAKYVIKNNFSGEIITNITSKLLGSYEHEDDIYMASEECIKNMRKIVKVEDILAAYASK